MNKDFLPILGEYDIQNKTLIISILSYTNITLNIDFFSHDDMLSVPPPINVQLKEYTTTQYKIPHIFNGKYTILFNKNDKININIDDNIMKKFNVFNCDCQFVPETGIWDDIDTDESLLCFHIGDQIYLDLLFMDMCKKLSGGCNSDVHISDYEIKIKVYDEYKNAFVRKINVLQSSFNIMLGDDHDICDESIRTKYDADITKRIINIFNNVYHDIQYSLRANDSCIRVIGNQTFLLIDNIRCLSTDQYAENMMTLIETHKQTLKNNVYILSPRVPTNYKLNLLVKLIYSTNDDTYNYEKLYTTLFSLNYKSLHILCGDEHSIKKIEIRDKRQRKLYLYFVGPINSIIDDYDANNYLTSTNYTMYETYYEKKHGYIIINDGIVIHKMYTCYLNKLFGNIMYGVKYLYHQ